MSIYLYIGTYLLFGACVTVIAENKDRKHNEKYGIKYKEKLWEKALSVILIATFWPVFTGIGLYYKIKKG